MQVNDRDLQILSKIVGYCNDIEHAHNEYNRDYMVFCSNPTYRNAVAMCLMQIGELAKTSLSDSAKEQITAIPWRQLYGMRNRIVHGYDGVNMLIVWQTVDEDIPQLYQELMKILKNL